jgi:hypothetical protein
MAISKPSASDVIDLTGTSLSTAIVSALIDDAALLAENCIASLDATRQEAIVKWITAHLITARDGGTLTSEKLGDASETRSIGQLGSGLNGTIYGQQALALDTTGCLSRLGRSKATIEVV